MLVDLGDEPAEADVLAALRFIRNLDTGELIDIEKADMLHQPHTMIKDLDSNALRPVADVMAPVLRSVSSLQRAATVLRSGYLWKRGHTLGGWTKRWFVLHGDGYLYHYASNTAAKPKGHAACHGGKARALDTQPYARGGYYGFNLEHRAERRVLFAANELELGEWVLACTRASSAPFCEPDLTLPAQAADHKASAQVATRGAAEAHDDNASVFSEPWNTAIPGRNRTGSQLGDDDFIAGGDDDEWEIDEDGYRVRKQKASGNGAAQGFDDDDDGGGGSGGGGGGGSGGGGGGGGGDDAEAFRPAFKVKIRSAEEVSSSASVEDLRSAALAFKSAAPPPPASRSRARGGGGSGDAAVNRSAHTSPLSMPPALPAAPADWASVSEGGTNLFGGASAEGFAAFNSDAGFGGGGSPSAGFEFEAAQDFGAGVAFGGASTGGFGVDSSFGSGSEPLFGAESTSGVAATEFAAAADFGAGAAFGGASAGGFGVDSSFGGGSEPLFGAESTSGGAANEFAAAADFGAGAAFGGASAGGFGVDSSFGGGSEPLFGAESTSGGAANEFAAAAEFDGPASLSGESFAASSTGGGFSDGGLGGQSDGAAPTADVAADEELGTSAVAVLDAPFETSKPIFLSVAAPGNDAVEPALSEDPFGGFGGQSDGAAPTADVAADEELGTSAVAVSDAPFETSEPTFLSVAAPGNDAVEPALSEDPFGGFGGQLDGGGDCGDVDAVAPMADVAAAADTPQVDDSLFAVNELESSSPFAGMDHLIGTPTDDLAAADAPHDAEIGAANGNGASDGGALNELDFLNAKPEAEHADGDLELPRAVPETTPMEGSDGLESLI
jgi:hypothetical protein